MSEPEVVEQDVQCARCGSSMDWTDCYACGGDGELEEPDEDKSVTSPCYSCDGKGGEWICLSGYAWCELNPKKGRATTPPGPEFFDVMSDGTVRIRATP
jgi:hypothetical protein